MTEELLPCPFCGDDSSVGVYKGPHGDRVSCTNCMVSMDDVTCWNTRALPKMKKVDLDNFQFTGSHDYCYGYGSAIDDIKSKYGDLYVEVK